AALDGATETFVRGNRRRDGLDIGQAPHAAGHERHRRARTILDRVQSRRRARASQTWSNRHAMKATIKEPIMRRLTVLASVVFLGASASWLFGAQQPATPPATFDPNNFVGQVTPHTTTDI